MEEERVSVVETNCWNETIVLIYDWFSNRKIRPLELPFDAYADSELYPFRTSMNVFAIALSRVKSHVPEFDQQPSLKEMIRYSRVIVGVPPDEEWNNFGCTRQTTTSFNSEVTSREHVLQACAKLTTTTSLIFGRIGQVFAGIDVVADIYGIYSVYEKGYAFLFVASLLLLLVNILIQNIRMLFISKECYNLRKLFSVGHGLTISPGSYKPFRLQGMQDRFTLNQPLEILSRIRQFGLRQAFKWKIDNVLHAAPPFYDIEMDEDELAVGIQNSFPEISWMPLFLAPSIKLAQLSIQWANRINTKLETMDESFVTQKQVMEFLHELIGFHFIKFEAAEMTKTELSLENIPQMLLRLIPIVEEALQVGLLKTYHRLGFQECILLACSFLSLGFGIVKTILDKIDYYFGVYGQGKDFSTPKYVFPDYDIENLLVCTLGHSLFLFSLLVMSASSLVSIRIKIIPFLIGLAILSFAFWKRSHIPFYSMDLTFTAILTSFSYSRHELALKPLLLRSLKKFIVTSIVLGLNLGVLYADEIYRQNLIVFGILVWSMCTAGMGLQIIDRILWQSTWGEDFESFTSSE